jgi:integrase/recombinase XerD
VLSDECEPISERTMKPPFMSHSGRRTFITNAARTISSEGGSLRDVQMLAGHSSLAVTQRYIEGDSDARLKVVDLV